MILPPIQFVIEACRCFMKVNEDIFEALKFKDILAKLIKIKISGQDITVYECVKQFDDDYYAKHLLYGLKKAKEAGTIVVECPNLFNQYVQELIDLTVNYFEEWEQPYQTIHDLKESEEYRKNLNKAYQNLFYINETPSS